MDSQGRDQSGVGGVDDRHLEGGRDNDQSDLDAEERVDTRMTITVTANDLHELRGKISLRELRPAIGIRWRRNRDDWNYDGTIESGCIIDARDVLGEEVEQSFTSDAAAISYLKSLFKKKTKAALKQKKQRQLEMAKKAAKECKK